MPPKYAWPLDAAARLKRPASARHLPVRQLAAADSQKLGKSRRRPIMTRPTYDLFVDQKGCKYSTPSSPRPSPEGPRMYAGMQDGEARGGLLYHFFFKEESHEPPLTPDHCCPAGVAEAAGVGACIHVRACTHARMHMMRPLRDMRAGVRRLGSIASRAPTFLHGPALLISLCTPAHFCAVLRVICVPSQERVHASALCCCGNHVPS